MEDTATASQSPSLPGVAAPRRRSALTWVLVLAFVVGVAFVLWRTFFANSAASPDADLQRLSAQVDALTHQLAQLHGNADTLRARLDDGDKVDKSVREQLLGLGERTRLLEDAVANLADKRLSGRDALLLNEAELLLTLGGERYEIFHDAAATSAAYRLADTALSEVEDAAFSTVRQSISAEIAALDALHVANSALVSAQLAQLRAQVTQLPVTERMPTPTSPPSTSRLRQILGAFVQVHRDDDAQGQAALHDTGLARELVVLDLHDADVALQARDAVRYRAALAEASAELGAVFDTRLPAVAAVSSQLDALDKSELAPPPPAIFGTALKELRNLRATHALRAPVGAAGKSDEAQK